VVFGLKVSEKDPSATNLLLLLVLKGALSISRRLEQNCSETSLLAFLVDLPLE
jgi:hypothetical protein